MAKRIIRPYWAKSLQRTLRALTRRTARAGAKALTQSLRPATKALKASLRPASKVLKQRRPATKALKKTLRPAAKLPRNSGTWLAGIAIGPSGARHYRIYRPSGVGRGESLPLLVMLHGCSQDADAFAASTRMNRIAERERFLVLYPEQDRLANPQRCWNWYETRSGLAQAEAAMVIAAIDQACLRHAADPQRVAVAGLSAGASMAALLALHHPERFHAVAMHSGVAPGLAQSSAGALAAMRGHRRVAALPQTRIAALPPLLVIQGLADGIVAPSNGRTSAELWAAASGAAPVATRSVRRGQRYNSRVTDFKRAGRVRVSLWEIDSLGHAWSGGAAAQRYSDAAGPDASRLVWAFAARQFASV